MERRLAGNIGQVPAAQVTGLAGVTYVSVVPGGQRRPLVVIDRLTWGSVFAT